MHELQDFRIVCIVTFFECIQWRKTVIIIVWFKKCIKLMSGFLSTRVLAICYNISKSLKKFLCLQFSRCLPLCDPNIHTYLHTYTHIHSRTHTRTHTYEHSRTHTLTHTYIHLHTYTRTDIQALMHTYTHTSRLACSVSQNTLFLPHTRTLDLGQGET